MRARTDLEFFCQRFGGAEYWVVKDPVALRYFQLREEEYVILRALDGRASLAEIATRFCERFAPRRLTEGRLQQFLGSLHASGLILSDRSGQGAFLLERGQEHRAKLWRAAASNVLAIRFPGVDPAAWLKRVYPLVAWMFSHWFVAVCITLMIVAALTATLNASELASRLPEVQAFFGPDNLPWLIVCLAAVKILHELGHAMACRHFGCECHEIGLLLLVFTPCLYCDITDSWTLSEKRSRMAISAAGIYVELALASVATLVWWSTDGGLLGALCLNVMVLCSVNTVLLNGNPLLRYDGYYLLSDWLEIPNLWQRSRALLGRTMERVLFGKTHTATLPENRPLLLTCYGLLSIAYRSVVVVLILILVYRVLRPMGLEIGGHLVTAATVLSMVVMPAVRQFRRRLAPGTGRGLGRRTVVACASLLLAAGLCLIPLPCRVRGPVLFEADDIERIYVPVSGQMLETCRVGDKVEQGDVLARLQNHDLGLEIATLRSQQQRQAAQLKALEARRGKDATASAELPAAREALDAIQSRLEARLDEAERLVLEAPRAGTVLPATVRGNDRQDRNVLGTWQGLPTDPWNVGCFLESGTHFCSIDAKQRLRAVAYLGEQDVQLVRPGDRTTILLEQARHSVVHGRVSRIDMGQIEAVPSRLAVLGTIPNEDRTGIARPIGTYYRLEIELEPTAAPALIGSRGKARIEVASRSLAGRAGRFVATFLRRLR